MLHMLNMPQYQDIWEWVRFECNLLYFFCVRYYTHPDTLTFRMADSDNSWTGRNWYIDLSSNFVRGGVPSDVQSDRLLNVFFNDGEATTYKYRISQLV